MMFCTYQTVTELKLAYNYSINHNQLQHQSYNILHILYSIKVKTCIYHTQYLIYCILIFDILIQFKLCQDCITGLMYHNMVIYRYIVASLSPSHPFIIMCRYSLSDPHTYYVLGKLAVHTTIASKVFTHKV